ncbi:peptidoglycan-binding domain-containing protein [Gymnodinialimonas ulvae]|uniref:peptidoglycan-binding domain-containing protein n=1 Tax=Gymnodinialimonas ulvae TaxID=3126504 RepID=UPI0030B0F8FF
MRANLIALTTGLFAGLAPLAAAADTALLIVNDRYRDAQNLREGAAIAGLRAPLEAVGFDVITVEDGTGEALRDGLDQLLAAEETGRVLIAATGHFARARSDSWLLGRDVDEPTLANVGGDGISLAVLMEVAASAPGRSVVLLGMERRRITLGDGLGAGIGRIEPPQGVSVVTGSPEDVADFARDAVLLPGADLVRAVDAAQNLRSFGFLSPDVAFLPADVAVEVTPSEPEAEPQVAAPSAPSAPSADETALWEAAVELNTVGAYRAYVERYPSGAHVAEARAQIDALEADPTAQARAAEDALNLSREQRQQIQRSLSILDYDTRGIDGIFGSGTRAAIRAWQTANARPVSGFLDAGQINTLGDQAAIRTAELEEEARIAAEERRRADQAYWQVTGQGARIDGVRDYLERFPDGLHADTAQGILDAEQARVRAEAEARDRAAWDVAQAADTVQAYRAYIEGNPDGAFHDQARARMNQINGNAVPSDAQITQLQAQEDALNIPPVTRSLIEQRLTALQLEPGRIDGRFDESTRRAIRRYQRARGLDVTGYLNEPTLVRLLAETVGGILQIDGILNR